MKKVLILFGISLIGLNLFGNGFKINPEKTFIIKNKCSIININNGIFKFDHNCIDSNKIKSLECLSEKNKIGFICIDKNFKKNYLIDFDYKKDKNKIYIFSNFLNIIELSYEN